MVMEMNSVNRTQSQQVLTIFMVKLKRNQTCVNIDHQKEFSKERDEESATESIGKKPKN